MRPPQTLRGVAAAKVNTLRTDTTQFKHLKHYLSERMRGWIGDKTIHP